MNKSLKFRKRFIDPIKNGEKTKTHRLFDDKNLAVGDILDLLDMSNGDKFATAKITDIKEQTFADMVMGSNDVLGQYEEFSIYYNREIKPTDPVKIVEFKLTKE